MRTVYCYHCMTYHHPDEMRQIVAHGRTRWRCRRSIDATHKSVEARDAFGREQSQRNLATAQAQRERLKLHRRALAHQP